MGAKDDATGNSGCVALSRVDPYGPAAVARR